MPLPMDNIEKKEPLDEKEEEFCNLYICGGNGFAGKYTRCYTEVFGNEKGNISVRSRKLLSKPAVQSRIKELAADLQNETETIAVKLQLSETLKAVMEETSTAQYIDKFGIALSPAPLRAVSVNAAKALMDLYPVKHSADPKQRGEGTGHGIVFNVIVPDGNTKKQEQD